MEVKHDKNLEPFGYCAECYGQLRVGGNPGRVRKFCRRYPWAAKPGAAPAIPVTVTVTEPDTGKVAPPVVEAAPVTVPVPVKRKATFADALAVLGATKGVMA